MKRMAMAALAATVCGTVAAGNVRDFGAVGDGVADDTAAIQRAIDAGGVVTVPEGVYLCGTLYLRSNGGLDLSPCPPFSRTSRSSTAAS